MRRTWTSLFRTRALEFQRLGEDELEAYRTGPNGVDEFPWSSIETAVGFILLFVFSNQVGKGFDCISCFGWAMDTFI